MKTDLASLFSNKAKPHSLWSELFALFLEKKPYPKKIIELRIENSLKRDLKDPFEYYSFLKELFSLFFLTRSYPYSFQDLFEKPMQIAKVNKFFSSFYAIEALSGILFYLYELKKPTFPMFQGHLFESGITTTKAQLPILQYNSEKAIFCLFFALIQKDTKSLEIAKNLIDEQSYFLDKNGIPFTTLWTKDEKYQSLEVLTSFYVMYELQEKIFEDSWASSVKKSIFEKIKKQVQNKKVELPIFHILLLSWFNEWIQVLDFKPDNLKEQKGVSFSSFSKIGFAKFHDQDFHSAFTFSGFETGLGMMRFHDIDISNFGPHLAPFHTLNGFGICRPCHYKKEVFSDLEILKGEHSLFLKGWTKLNTGLKPKAASSNIWMEWTSNLKENECDFQFYFEGLNEEDQMAISFFATAGFCEIDHMHVLYPRTLNRFSQDAKKVTLKSKNFSLSIESDFNNKVYITPLSGKENFWESDFLVSFRIGSNSQKGSMEIKAFENKTY